MDMVGFPSTGGWSLLSSERGGVDLMPTRDSPVVARMKAAGAIILGKTNIPILSCSGTHANDSWAGPTLNAMAPEYVPGASSAGTATAVAASFCVLGLAEETGGSIQNPASAQGLVGVKPTFGLVPNTGVMPLSSQRDVVGPIARCVRDAALALDVLAGFSMDDPKTVSGIDKIPVGGYSAQLSTLALQNTRLGLYGRGWRPTELHQEVSKLYSIALDEISALGAELIPDPFEGTDFTSLAEVIDSAGAETFDYRGMESLPFDMHMYLQRMGPDAAINSFSSFLQATAAVDVFSPGAVLSALSPMPEFQDCLANPTIPPEMKAFSEARLSYRRIFEKVMDEKNIDALVFPQMLSPPPTLFAGVPIQESTVSEINIAGLPGVTVPAGVFSCGVPFCLIFVGRLWAEAALLNLAYAYESATHHRKAPVLVTV